MSSTCSVFFSDTLMVTQKKFQRDHKYNNVRIYSELLFIKTSWVLPFKDNTHKSLILYSFKHLLCPMGNWPRHTDDRKQLGPQCDTSCVSITQSTLRYLKNPVDGINKQNNLLFSVVSRPICQGHKVSGHLSS